MTSSWSSWIRVFDIPEIDKHKNGFTIYKTISILYPKSCPEAITQMTVWKRFNDFKLLYKEIKYLSKKLNINDEIPSLPKSSLFKRFDEETINNRKTAILKLLEYIGNHSSLFTSIVFVKFFETSHSSSKSLTGNINSIRAELNLPEDIDCYENVDDDKLSDTDSFTSSNFDFLTPMDNISISSHVSKTNLKKLNSLTSIDSQSSKTSSDNIINVENNFSLLDEPFSFNDTATITTTTSTTIVDENGQYLIDASIHVNMALELEIDKKYEEAFTAYKAAIDILIRGGKDDPNYDRKQMVKYKTNKYLIRAEKIFNMHLTDEIKCLRLYSDVKYNEPSSSSSSMKNGPIYNLYKYKVIKIISSSGMLVMHSENQLLYYVKVIYKTMKFLNDSLILPENVPYMIKLCNHYNLDNALFLILEYCSGKKLSDYINIEYSSNKSEEIEQLSDQESEQSFSDLINEYSIKIDKKSNNHDDDDDDDDVECEGATAFIKNDKTDKKPPPPPKLISIDDNFNDSFDEFDGRKYIPEDIIKKWTSQLLMALEKLHTLGIICRNISMNNLLIDESNNIRLTYMCNIKEFADLDMMKLTSNLAPELYSFEEITNAVDWWSFGTILYELLVGIPFNKIHPHIVMTNIDLNIPNDVSPEGQSLLKQLLIYEPKERLGVGLNGIQHIKSHPFYKTINWTS